MKKTILITGSTDGIGKLTALKLAKEGHEIYLHGRNATKLETVISEIKSESNNESVKGFLADFSDLEAVKKMAGEISEKLSKLDVLINNAGVLKVSKSIAENGFDVRLVVNYLAPYLLTNGLLPLFNNSKNPRIINLSSAAQATISSQFFEKNSSLSDNEAYAQSKLAILLWSFDFAKKHHEITTIALNPGSLLNTKMVKEAYGKFWSSVDKGADIIIDLAIDPKYANSSGLYFDNDRGQFGEAHQDAYQDQKIEALISKTRGLLDS